MVGKSEKNNEIRDSERRGIRPGFLGGDGDTKKPARLTDDANARAMGKKESRNAAAENNLKKSEEAASSGLYKPGNGLAGAREAENEPTSGFYKGAEGKKGKLKGKGNGKVKKVSPFVAIILSIFGFGGVMMGAQMFQPFSLVAQFREKFNSMSISTNLRSSKMLKWQMSDITDGNVKDPVRGTIFGTKLYVTKSQQKKLAAQGIDYDESTKTMSFVDADGTPHKITADNFDDYYVNNAEFHQAYNTGSKTWRGQFANWFGSTVINFITNNRLTRNMFADFRERVNDSPGESSLDVFKKIISEKIAQGDSSTGGVERKKGQENEEGELETDENGKPKLTNASEEEGDVSVSRSNMQTQQQVKDKLEKISGGFSKGVNYACMGLQFFGTVSILATAAEILQIINLVTATFETVDKTKAGYGDGAPINDLAESLNAKKTTTNYKLTGTDNTIREINDDTGVFNDLQFKEETVTKSAMESAGIAALYGNGKVNPNDPSVGSFNLSQSLNGIFGGIVASGTSFASCAVLKNVAAGVSAATDALSIIACIAGVAGAAFSFGASTAGCGPLAYKLVKGVALSAGIAVLFSAVISLITPVVTQAFTRDLVSNLGGEDFGNALTSGANIYQGSAHRAAGGSLATSEQYAAYLVEQQQVIADNARYERESLSPFDPTSKYTFMGSLVQQLGTFMTSSGSLMSTITTGGAVLSNSIVAMSPTAMAYNISEILPDNEKYYETCPFLASIDAVGDAFCNPYIMTDTTTMSMEPNEVLEKVSDLGGLADEGRERTSDDNVVVADNSELAKYIVYCDNRESSFGIADNNIANSIGDHLQVNTSMSSFNALSNGAIGAIPVFGDIVDIVNNTDQLANMGYITGASCVAGNNNVSEFSSSPEWNSEAKYYQRFIEDQALAESMGLIEKSAATAYYEKYLEENPLDNSLEGILARYSGVDKETVAFIFDLIWYEDYIANYDPSERYAFGQPEVELPEETMDFRSENVLASMMTGAARIIYADVRNRNYTV